MILGHITIRDYLESTKGEVRGKIFTDGKDRWYAEDYDWNDNNDGSITIFKRNHSGDQIRIKCNIELDEGLVGFFGLYSGDGSKGTDDERNQGQLKVSSISFSQKEPNLIKYAITYFRKLFINNVHFNFLIGEDSAWFMEGEGKELLKKYHGGVLPPIKKLSEVQPHLSKSDLAYLSESRDIPWSNEECLAFYYQFQKDMNYILGAIKLKDLQKSKISLSLEDKIIPSVRRPFKKGSRTPGKSSRADELTVGGLRGFGPFFLKILYEIEESIYFNTQRSTQGLVCWSGLPSNCGELVSIKDFFSNNIFGCLNHQRPKIGQEGLYLIGKWPRSNQICLMGSLRISPLWCYTSGLYLAEGSTSKNLIFKMFNQPVTGLNLGFTSSEGTSICLVLKALHSIFRKDDCLNSWKIKVGAQYFPELVMIGLKYGVPLLRGGEKGQGKLKTMEVSLALKDWALYLAPCLNIYENKYSHVEPTGSGIARVDFSASSALCKWYFPLMIYALFKSTIVSPAEDFVDD